LDIHGARGPGKPASRACSAAEGAQSGEAVFEIGDQIGGLLEANMEAAERAGEFAGAGGARDEAGGRQGEAFIAAPRRADAEGRQALDHGMRRLGAVAWLEDDSEEAAG